MQNTFSIKMVMSFLNERDTTTDGNTDQNICRERSGILVFDSPNCISECGDGPCTARFLSQFSQANWCVRLTARDAGLKSRFSFVFVRDINVKLCGRSEQWNSKSKFLQFDSTSNNEKYEQERPLHHRRRWCLRALHGPKARSRRIYICHCPR
jgi:hypothetical protein